MGAGAGSRRPSNHPEGDISIVRLRGTFLLCFDKENPDASARRHPGSGLGLAPGIFGQVRRQLRHSAFLFWITVPSRITMHSW